MHNAPCALIAAILWESQRATEEKGTTPGARGSGMCAHPAVVLISFAWLRKVPHCVVAVVAQRKQGGA
jgi:hypothetical protein